MPSNKNVTTAAGPVVQPEWLTRLPAPVAAIVNTLIVDLFRPSDTPAMRLCKVATGAIVPSALFIFVRAVQLSLAPDLTGIAQAMAVSSHVVTGMVFIAGWLVVKFFEHELATVALNANAIVGLLCIVLTSASDVAFSGWVGCTLIVMCLLAIRSPYRMAVIAMCAVGIVVGIWNQAVVEANEGDTDGSLMLPGALTRPTAEQRAVSETFIAAMYATLLVLLEVAARESTRLSIATQQAADVVSSVADALASYNTDRAAQLLADAAGTSVVDAGLLERFDAIVANLTRYRPHLPNWVVEGGPEKAAPGDGEGDAGSPTANDATGDDDGDEGSSVQRRRRWRGGGDASGSARAQAMGASASVTMPTASPGALPGHVLDVDSTEPFRRRIAIADVMFRVPSASELREARGLEGAEALAAMAAAAHRFVDRVHLVAEQTKAAVHGFAGDVVRVSWNAASRAPQAEVRAARFLARLRADAGDGLVRAWGAAAWGDARVHLAGTAGRKALLVAPAFAGAWDAARQLAARYEAFVADEHVYRGANHAVVFRGIGVSVPPSRSSPKVESICSLFEICAEASRPGDASDDLGPALDAAGPERLLSLTCAAVEAARQQRVSDCRRILADIDAADEAGELLSTPFAAFAMQYQLR